jgi:L-ascorbate metabolism protein UlaG (beta-lactamase superfamily)
MELTKPDGKSLRITATPARHGPAGIEPLSGDVIGFVLTFEDETGSIYVTGDTVWYDGVAEVARRFRVSTVLLFAGAARTRGPFNLTMDTNDAIETAHAFPDATIVSVHSEGWAHDSHDQPRGLHRVVLAGTIEIVGVLVVTQLRRGSAQSTRCCAAHGGDRGSDCDKAISGSRNATSGRCKRPRS